MKKIITTSLIAASLAAFATSASAVTIFSDNFSTNTLAADYDILNVTYNTTAESVTIARAVGSNFLEVKNAFDLSAAPTTELTVAFNFAFGGSMFGSGFTVDYNDGGGVTGWQTILSQGYTGANASDTVALNPLTVTITKGATYAFTDTAKIRIIGTTNNGGKGYTIDDLDVSVNAVPEPSSFALISGCLALTSIMLRRRRS